MELFVIAGIVCALVFLLCSTKLQKKYPPGPWGLPIIGHLHLLGTLPHQYLSKLSLKYGPITMIKLGVIPTLVVSSAEVAKDIFTTHDLIFGSRPKFAATKYLFYNAKDVVWCDYGPYWRHMKKVCTVELFTAKRIEDSRHIRSEELSLFFESIMVEGNQGKIPVMLSVKLSVFTMNVIMRMTIGRRLFGGFSRSSEKFIFLINELFELFADFYIGDFVPALSWLDSRHIRKLKHVHKQIDNILKEIIEEHRSSKQGDRLPDLVDILLSLPDVEDDGICAIILDMIAAATDTSTVTIEWGLSELINNPKFMLKAQEELDKVVGIERLVTESDLPHLKYLKSILKEVFRLHPAAPLLLPHESTEECILRGYTIPKNTRLMVNVWAIGRDPTSWDSPEEFNPERFVGNAMDVKGQDFELLPFGSGRRMCPGLGLGLCMIELTMARLVQGFDWRGVDGQPLDMQEMGRFTVPRKVPLNVIAAPRLPRHVYLPAV